MKRALLAILFIIVLAGESPVLPVAGQEGTAALTLRLSRDFGFGLGTQIQGRFSYRVEAPDDVERVEFLLDGEVIGEDGEPPFRFVFSTDAYEVGWHRLSVRGYTTGGEILTANTLQREFVAAQQTFTYLGGVLLLAVAFIVARYLITRPRGTDASGQQRRRYGLLGGAVCPRCGRPFSLPIWSINLMAGRVTRCPHCGRWSFVQRASPQALAEAEALEQALDEGSEMTAGADGEEARRRRRLEDSRYDDL